MRSAPTELLSRYRIGRSGAVSALTSTGGAPARRPSASAHASVSDGATEHSTAPGLNPGAAASPPALRSSASRVRLTSSAVARPLVRRQWVASVSPRKSPTTVSLFPTSTAIRSRAVAFSPDGGFDGAGFRVAAPRSRADGIFLPLLAPRPHIVLAPAARHQPREPDAHEVEQRHRHAHHDLRRDHVAGRDQRGHQE